MVKNINKQNLKYYCMRYLSLGNLLSCPSIHYNFKWVPRERNGVSKYRDLCFIITPRCAKAQAQKEIVSVREVIDREYVFVVFCAYTWHDTRGNFILAITIGFLASRAETTVCFAVLSECEVVLCQ